MYIHLYYTDHSMMHADFQSAWPPASSERSAELSLLLSAQQVVANNTSSPQSQNFEVRY